MNTPSNVLILGGGAIGMCAAHYLSREGAAVTVIDKGEMGHGCSLHNAGFVSPSHFTPLASPGLVGQAIRWMVNPRSPFYIRPRVNWELVKWMYRFWRSCDESTVRRAMPLLRDLLNESSRLTDQLSREEGMSFPYVQRGLSVLYISDRGKRACEHEAAAASEIGVESRLLDTAGLEELEPGVKFRAKGGLFFPGDSHLMPAAFVRDLASSLARGGVQLVSNCTVTGFDADDGKISSVRTDRGEFRADEIVFTLGAWSPGLLRKLGIRMLMQAGKGYSVTVERPPVKPTRSYILNERRVAVTPFPDSLRFAGTMEITGLDLRLNHLRIDAIRDAVPLYFGNIGRPDSDGPLLWAGLRPVTPDGLPYLGRLRRYPNAVVAAGHAMLGISLAAVSGKLVAEIVAGRKTSIPIDLLTPERFMHSNSHS